MMESAKLTCRVPTSVFSINFNHDQITWLITAEECTTMKFIVVTGESSGESECTWSWAAKFAVLSQPSALTPLLI